ncbi:hypothetical protein F2Q69_00061478 [Brassica cretica]|uniref:Uncharacterized protein n=1 Tax=Brassica cretica TaxID=69181 RepID=A0A8S9RIN4_BRACR|nr:hypothetical protein F2Q69_00061478 [Brassica cretica]
MGFLIEQNNKRIVKSKISVRIVFFFSVLEPTIYWCDIALPKDLTRGTRVRYLGVNSSVTRFGTEYDAHLANLMDLRIFSSPKQSFIKIKAIDRLLKVIKTPHPVPEVCRKAAMILENLVSEPQNRGLLLRMRMLLLSFSFMMASILIRLRGFCMNELLDQIAEWLRLGESG